MRILVSLFVALLATPAVLVGSAELSTAQVVNQDPDAHDDQISVSTATTPITLDVLANDSDPDGDALTIVSARTIAWFAATVAVSSDGQALFYTPGSGSSYDYLVYEIDDGHGGTDTAIVSVFLDIPVPPASPIEVTPPRVDFGTVPLGKVASVQLTIKNISQQPIAPLVFQTPQLAPEPFEANTSFCSLSSSSSFLQPGDECQHTVRFWSVADADDASPAVLQISAGTQPNDPLTVVPLYAAPPAPPVPVPPNAAPVAVDDVVLVHATGGALDPTANDSDADDDQVTVSAFVDPPHGSGFPETCRDVGFWRSLHATCVSYVPDLGFIGVDELAYTISDGRGGTDDGVMYMAVFLGSQSPYPQINAVTPNHGQPAGGHTVTITGANFLPTSFVTFHCAGAPTGAETSFVSTTQLTVSVPSLPTGLCDVEVNSNLSLSSTLAGGYTVDAPLPTVLPGGGSVTEGNSGTKTMDVGVRLSAPSTQPVTVQWTTLQLTGSTHADGSNDYTPASDTVTFAPGETSKTVSIIVNGDSRDEPDEHVFVSWHSSTNAVVGGFYGLGYGVIRDDDPPPKVEPGLASVAEGDAGTAIVNVPVSLSAASGRTVTVQWTTVPNPGSGFADATTDYVPASGVVTFDPGETSKTVPVNVNGDQLDEPDEYIVVSFHHPTNAVMGGFWGLGFGVIQDDD